MICRLAAAAAVLHLVAGAPALPLPLQKYKRVVTPNNQHETLDGIGIPIGILGVKTRVSVEGGVVSVPLWGVSGPNSRDVRQGGMPDCWLDAAMVGLADLYPEFFRGRFTTPDGGLFPDKAAVTLTKDSEKKTYWVNYLDVAQSTLFPGKKSNSHGGVYWWPSLVESAIQSWYADHGQLDALSSGGYPSDSIELLTGVKSAQWMEDEAATWTRFQRGNKIPVVITTKPNSTRTLISFHAYTISLAEEKNGVKWVTVRNPWHETQRHKFEDVYADISSVGHYVDVDATPTNDV